MLSRSLPVAVLTATALLLPAVAEAAPIFDDPVTYTGATRAEDAAFADVSGDGTGDLVVASYDNGGGGLRLFTGTGGGAFDPLPGTFAGTLTGAVATGKLNGDDRPDVVSLDANNVTVRLGAPGAGLGSPAQVSVAPGRPLSLAIADLSGDGLDDLAVGGDDGGSFPSGRVWVLLNDGDGGFSAPTEPIYLGSNRSASGIVAADLDGDGDRDLATANGGRQDVSVLRNKGAGVFPADEFDADYETITMLSSVGGLASGDVTGDGKRDLVATYQGELQVLRGDGAGTFAPDDATFTIEDQVSDLELSDLDGDGKLDAIASSRAQNETGRVYVLRGTGAGVFEDATALETGFGSSGNATSVRLTDVDADTKPDIVATSWLTNRVSVLRNITPIPVAPTVTITTPPLTKATYTVGQVVVADYACADDAPGLSCTGPVADGAAIDTSTVGTNRRFEVVAKDAGGLETRVAHFYDVVEPPVNTVKVEPKVEPRVEPRVVAPTPPAAPAPKPKAAQALERQAAPVTKAVSLAKPNIPATSLLKPSGLLQPISTTRPNTLVIGGFVVSAGGANVVAAGGANVVAAGGANVVSAGGANVVSAGGANVVSAGGANLFPRAFGAATRKPKLKMVVLARGQRTFAKPGSGQVPIKLTKAGRALLRKAFARKGRQSVKVTYALGFAEPGSGLPTVVTTRTITIKE